MTSVQMMQMRREASLTSINLGITVLCCVLLFLLFNPFLALFVLAVVSLYQRVPAGVVVVSASISFTLFFYFREYGVNWYLNSTDDVPSYISIYQSNYGLSFTDLLSRFISMPNGGEPLWHLPWWFLLNTFELGDNTFVFLHYLVIFVASFLALATISRRNLIPLAVVYYFLTPISIDAAAHIWRQQLAFCLFLGGAGLSLRKGSSKGGWLVFLSIFVHLSCVFYCALFFAVEWIRRRAGFDNKLKVTAILAAIMLGMPALSTAVVFFLDSIGLSRIMSYFEGYGTDVMRVYLIMGFYAAPLLGAFYFLRNDAMNNLFMVLCFAVFSIVLALPGANSIYDRLLMFVLPLWGIYFFRALVMNFSNSLCLPVLVVVFVTGVLRLHAPLAVGTGVGNFLAYGNAFDPFMGVLKMLTTL